MKMLKILIFVCGLFIANLSYGQLAKHNVVVNKLVDKTNNVELIIYSGGELEVYIKEDKTPNIETLVDIYQTEFDVPLLDKNGEENGGEMKVLGQKFQVAWQQINKDSDKGTYNMDIVMTIRDELGIITKRNTETITFELK